MENKYLNLFIKGIVAYVLLTILSFVMDMFINKSELSFMEFFKSRWYVTLALVVIFLGYQEFKNNKTK
ncbi:hypothetical protein [Frigoriflavimonas asaccharolytica]|uniref:Uncharacterized protein n=1 Tax=Frigoriflavimonas asaccharolytica TaxID=2735899 RepID=A0A8J8G6Q1_9FLAO|nr:hypothetical protein [Frigoriflavimonas asaccharolytica]NRS92503.1 hypothetical protein [Frigoriflavimonas asaccharolytica]